MSAWRTPSGARPPHEHVADPRPGEAPAASRPAPLGHGAADAAAPAPDRPGAVRLEALAAGPAPPERNRLLLRARRRHPMALAVAHRAARRIHDRQVLLPHPRPSQESRPRPPEGPAPARSARPVVLY